LPPLALPNIEAGERPHRQVIHPLEPPFPIKLGHLIARSYLAPAHSHVVRSCPSILPYHFFPRGKIHFPITIAYGKVMAKQKNYIVISDG
jgi:hypothetical protein